MVAFSATHEQFFEQSEATSLSINKGAPFCCPLKKVGSNLIAMVVSSLQSIQDEFFIDSVECVHQGFEHDMDMSRQRDGSFWQEW